jgi:hypothetical protein
MNPIKYLSEFRRYASRLVARHDRKAKLVIGTSYTIGDVLVATIPPAGNGFIRSVIDLHPDWPLLMASYGGRPLPALISIVFVVSSAGIAKKYFAAGHAGQGVGATVLAYDLFMHGQVYTAITCLPTVVGGSFGGGYRPLERTYGAAENWVVRNTLGSPKKMAGFFFSLTAGPTIISSILDRNWPMLAAAGFWLSGNIISMLLRRDDQLPNVRPHGLPSGGTAPRIGSPQQ